MLDRSTRRRRVPCGADRVGRANDERLDAAHHRGVVGVCLVELEHRELGVVRPVDALISKVVPDLVHAVESADDQPLEIQLVGDAQKQRHVERVVVRGERPRRRATVQRLQHRRLHFEISECHRVRAESPTSSETARERVRGPPDGPRDPHTAADSAAPDRQTPSAEPSRRRPLLLSRMAGAGAIWRAAPTRRRARSPRPCASGTADRPHRSRRRCHTDRASRMPLRPTRPS